MAALNHSLRPDTGTITLSIQFIHSNKHAHLNPSRHPVRNLECPSPECIQILRIDPNPECMQIPRIDGRVVR